MIWLLVHNHCEPVRTGVAWICARMEDSVHNQPLCIGARMWNIYAGPISGADSVHRLIRFSSGANGVQMCIILSGPHGLSNLVQDRGQDRGKNVISGCK